MDRYQIRLGKTPPPQPLPKPQAEDVDSGKGQIIVVVQGREYKAQLQNYNVVSNAYGVSKRADIVINSNQLLKYSLDCDLSIFNNVLNHTIRFKAGNIDFYYLVQNINSTYEYGCLTIIMSGIIQESGK